MVTYEKLSDIEMAVVEAMEQEEELSEREGLSYQGYTTTAVRTAKAVVLNVNATREELQEAVDILTQELTNMLDRVGKEVDKPLSAERILMLKWQQRQARLRMSDGPFQAASPSRPSFEVTTMDDGTEVIERRRSEGTGRSLPSDSAADRYIEMPVESEELEAAKLQPEKAVVQMADVNHIRYIMGLAYRRLGEYEAAERVHYDILHNDLHHVEAIESLLELYAGLQQTVKIRALLDFFITKYAAGEPRRPYVSSNAQPLGKTSIRPSDREASDCSDSSDNRIIARREEVPDELCAEQRSPCIAPIEMAMVLLSDLVTEAAARHCMEHGEGSTSRFFADILEPIVHHLGPPYASSFVNAVFRSIDEQHFMARFQSDGCPPAAVNLVYSMVIAFLKTLLVRNMDKMMDDPVQFRMDVLSKLHAALRASGRKHESYPICEQLLKLYRRHSSLYATRMREVAQREKESSLKVASTALPPSNTDDSNISLTPQLLDDYEAAYKAAYFQYISDRACDSVPVGRRLCLEAISEYPREARPLEILALLLHREDPVRNLKGAMILARHALRMEPLSLSVVLTLANFYKANKRFTLYDAMMERYRLLSYMSEEDASESDMLATADELLALERSLPVSADEEDLVEATGRPMREYIARLEQSTAYSLPIDVEKRTFSAPPIKSPTDQLGLTIERPLSMDTPRT